jgi:hypothetical protein
MTGNHAIVGQFLEVYMTTTQNEFADEVCEHIKERISEIPKNKAHTVQQMFDKGVWDSFSDGDRRSAGQIVSMQVKNNALPLVYSGKVKGNTKAYQVI